MPRENGYYNKYLTRKYILGYIIVAIVFYGAAVFLLGRGSAIPSGAPLTGPSTKVNLVAQNNSNENGSVSLQPVNNGSQTLVTIELGNEPPTPQPAHIHMGACPSPGDVKYPLNDVVDGKSQTTVNVPYDSLKTMLPLVVNVHLSSADLNTYVSCGDLSF